MGMLGNLARPIVDEFVESRFCFFREQKTSGETVIIERVQICRDSFLNSDRQNELLPIHGRPKEKQALASVPNSERDLRSGEEFTSYHTSPCHCQT